MRHIFPAALFFGVLTVFAGCGAGNNIAIAKSAVKEFHQRLNSQQEAVIYDFADPEFKKSASRDTLLKMFASMHRKLGACSDSNAVSFVYNLTTGGNFVELKYNTTCTSGALQETFRWHMLNNRATLCNYNAESPLLLTD